MFDAPRPVVRADAADRDRVDGIMSRLRSVSDFNPGGGLRLSDIERNRVARIRAANRFAVLSEGDVYGLGSYGKYFWLALLAIFSLLWGLYWIVDLGLDDLSGLRRGPDHFIYQLRVLDISSGESVGLHDVSRQSPEAGYDD